MTSFKTLVAAIGTLILLCSAAKADDLQDLANPDINVRFDAFYDLTDGATQATISAEPLRSALVTLLSTEVLAFNQDTAQPNDLGLGDYFSDVVTVAVQLNDSRTIPALASILFTGNMVIDAVVGFGSASVSSIISHASDSLPEERGTVMIALTRLIQPGNPQRITNPTLILNIKNALLSGESDSDQFVSKYAERGMATLVSPSGIPGDVNGDGTVDCTDLDLVKSFLGKKAGQTGFNAAADVNDDGVVDIKDLAFVSNQLPAGTHCQ